MKTRLLVIDDEPQITAIFTTLFSRCGYEVQPVNDPRQAVAAALRFDPHVIFADISMPEIEGRQLAVQLESALPRRIPLVFLTALAKPADSGRTYLGKHLLLAKPINLQQVLTCLRKLITPAQAPSVN